MIDPVDTEREQTEDRPDARIFPNPVVPIGTGTTSVNPGVIPGIAIAPELDGPRTDDPDGCDTKEEIWHYKTQEQVAQETAKGKAWHRETPTEEEPSAHFAAWPEGPNPNPGKETLADEALSGEVPPGERGFPKDPIAPGGPRETPPDAGDLAAQESDARPRDNADAT